MSMINGVNEKILESQLSNVQIRQAIDVKLAKKALAVTEAQAAAALKLLDAAAEMAKEAGTSDYLARTLGSIASGLGQNLDVLA
jgi:hypothetical protein